MTDQMTDTTAPRTAAREKGHEPGWHDGIAPVHDWTGECRVCLLIDREREAIEPLLALVRAAEDEVGTGPTYELDRALRALPESVRVAARKPE